MTVTKLPEGVRLIKTGSEQARCGRRTMRTVNLLSYDVELNGTLVGRLQQKLETFETKTPGKRYVNYRWQSPRWYWSLLDHRQPRYGIESREYALRYLLNAVEAAHKKA